MEIFYTPNFRRCYKKLSSEIKDLAESKEAIFRSNPFDRKLGTHKLQGRLKDFWAFSINSKYRIIFEFIEKQNVVFHSVGDHVIYE